MSKVRHISDSLERVLRRSGLPIPAPVFTSERLLVAPTPSLVSPLPGAQKHLSSATTLLAVLATGYTLYLASALILPIVIAILLSFLLRGPVRGLRRLGIPESVGAAVVVLGGAGLLIGALVILTGPAQAWIQRAPQALAETERKLRSRAAPIFKLEATAARVEQLATGAGDKPAATPSAPAPRTGVLRRVFGSVASGAAMTLSVLFLAFFLLASGDLFLRKLMKVLPYAPEHDGAPQRVSEQVEAAVSLYLRTTVLINTGLGLVTWGVLEALGMPNAALWGAVAGALNFIPYVGALLTLALFAVAAITVFTSIEQALLVPGAFLAINLVESYAVTPILMGRQFPVNNVALFIGVLFWGFIWGIPGAVLAVPITVTLKIVSDSIPSLHTLGEFLGQ